MKRGRDGSFGGVSMIYAGRGKRCCAVMVELEDCQLIWTYGEEMDKMELKEEIEPEESITSRHYGLAQETSTPHETA